MKLKKSWDVWCRSEPSARSTRLGSLPGAISHAASSLAGSLPRSGSVCAKEPSDGLPNFHFLKSVRMPTKNKKILPQAQRHEHSFSFDYLSLIFHEYFCKKKKRKNINYPKSRFRPFSWTLDVSILRLGSWALFSVFDDSFTFWKGQFRISHFRIAISHPPTTPSRRFWLSFALFWHGRRICTLASWLRRTKI